MLFKDVKIGDRFLHPASSPDVVWIKTKESDINWNENGVREYDGVLGLFFDSDICVLIGEKYEV